MSDNMSWQFFVAGINEKAGTTWMELMLNGHPEIYCKSESDFIVLLHNLKGLIDAHETMVSKKDHDLHRHFFRPSDQAIFMAWTLLVNHAMHKYTLDENGGYKWVGDKTPNYANSLDLMVNCFPHAKFVVMSRDIRDVAASGWIAALRTSPQWIQQQFKGDMRNYSVNVANNAARRIQSIENAKKAAPDRVFVVSYEDLHKDLRTKMTEISTFITGNADHVDTMMKAGKWEKHTGGRKRGAEDQSSFFRKGIVGDYKNVLDLESIRILDQCMEQTFPKIDFSIPHNP